jgi:hypothetical protein
MSVADQRTATERVFAIDNSRIWPENRIRFRDLGQAGGLETLAEPGDVCGLAINLAWGFNNHRRVRIAYDSEE